jgi:hypothetical protein
VGDQVLAPGHRHSAVRRTRRSTVGWPWTSPRPSARSSSTPTAGSSQGPRPPTRWP